MATQHVLQVASVSKRYRIGGAAYGTLRDRLRRKAPRERTWLQALDDVSLAVQAGELLALVGANGAGKSTLLKVVARITHPDAGTVQVRAPVASLIEIGAGFHPELTARENVLFHGCLLGRPASHWRKRMTEIAEFADLVPRWDQPLKQFSTGMIARLGFSVAVHADPALLLVDEVLAVGDIGFQERGLARMRALRSAGTGLLFVSHDVERVAQVADRVAWFDAGSIRQEGRPGDVLPAYARALRVSEPHQPQA